MRASASAQELGGCSVKRTAVGRLKWVPGEPILLVGKPLVNRSKKPDLDSSWRWPTGWRSRHLPTDTREDFALEMEIAEMLSGMEERDPEAYDEMMKRRNDEPNAR
jgi:hypothetical protein